MSLSTEAELKSLVADDFEVSIFLTDISSPHATLTRQKVFHPSENGKGRGTQEQPVNVNDDSTVPNLRRESSDEAKIDLDAIPSAGSQGQNVESAVHVADSDDDEAESDEHGGRPSSQAASDSDDKKKMGLTTAYAGFQIYGRILCLIVTRKDGPKAAQPRAGGQAMMEEWITSTQNGAAATVEGS